MSSSGASHEGLNILCIDGGGARGLSALILVEEIMKRIQPLNKLDSPPHPYQCFDLIAGTGTGAVQACMLGRLRMPVHSAIVAYASLAKDVFSEKKRWGSGSFKTTRLKESLRTSYKTQQENRKSLCWSGNNRRANAKRKKPVVNDTSYINFRVRYHSLVFAMSRHNMRAGIPTAFRSYPVAANAGPECTVWETLCATMAHPDLFKSFDIGSPPLNQSFVDAGLGCNNPLVHVLAEVKVIYPDRYVATITSVGTGHTRTIQIPNISRGLLPIAALTATKNIATDTERVAEEMTRRFNSTKGVYFRLNVDQGMQSVDMDGWEQLAEVREHTRAYMRLVDASKRIDKMAHMIHSRKLAVPTAQIDGEIQAAASGASDTPVVQRCPAPTPIFTGCESIIQSVESCVSGNIMERKVCVIHGLGGAGKTQLALKVIERTYDKWGEIVFVDASTRESIEGALKAIAVAKKVGTTYNAALQWLQACCEPWLVVFDNADDPSVPIRDYIPGGSHGSIIITTRLSGMVSLAQGTDSDCSVSSMHPDDAIALLLKSARKQDQVLSDEELAKARVLLQDMGYLALAVVHAGAFIGHSPHMSITEYRSLFMAQKQRALEAYSRLPAAVKIDSYGRTVYTAWLMCYGLLSPRAQELLWLVACLHHTGITVEIFRRAATRTSSYKPEFPTTEFEDSAQQKINSFLGHFLDISETWDGLSFTETMNEISSRSLLEYDSANQSYRMHVLVQGWVRTVVPDAAHLTTECAMSLLSMSTPLDQRFESIMFRLRIGPHVNKVVVEASNAISPNHTHIFSEVLEDMGEWEKASVLRRMTREKTEEVLGKDHPDTLTSMNNLANTYGSLGRYEDASALHSEALDVLKRVLGKDHPDTLTSMNNLANTYGSLGRYEDASALHSEALDGRKRVLGKDHPDTLTSMNNLAITYRSLGRYEDASALHSEALDGRKRVLGKDHPTHSQA
ncbi:acyl transferase/acyl hydrolase/lysophospholipase [Rhizoctonia solani]|nr:acyl transferase/acyl hydrolase/lysophospholipase [Rhizoctonia solani]